MLFYVERSRHADLDFTALRGKYCSCKKTKKRKQMLLFADTESIIQPPPLCDPRSELQARKKRISTTALNET